MAESHRYPLRIQQSKLDGWWFIFVDDVPELGVWGPNYEALLDRLKNEAKKLYCSRGENVTDIEIAQSEKPTLQVFHTEATSFKTIVSRPPAIRCAALQGAGQATPRVKALGNCQAWRAILRRFTSEIPPSGRFAPLRRGIRTSASQELRAPEQPHSMRRGGKRRACGDGSAPKTNFCKADLPEVTTRASCRLLAAAPRQ
jgi:hypothetical protein